MLRSRIAHALIILLQWFGAAVAYSLSLLLATSILPVPQAMLEVMPPVGVLAPSPAMLVNAGVNSLIMVWAARRVSFRGVSLWLALLLILFGVQWVETQIETGYFLSAFPLLQGGYETYRLVLRGLIASGVFTLLTTLLVGGFSSRPRPEAAFVVTAARAVRQGAWLAAVYVVLYMLFGYFVAWQSQELRLFYGGPAQLNSLVDQWGLTLMGKPELPVFQYFRGALWLLCLIPLFKGFFGGRVELTVLSFLTLALLPTIALMYPNPLMPAGVTLAHFWEVAISNGIFGALCTWFVPQEKAAA